MKPNKKKELVANAVRKAMKAEMLLELLVTTLELEYDENLTIAKVMEELYKVRSEAERMAGNDPLAQKEDVHEMEIQKAP